MSEGPEVTSTTYNRNTDTDQHDPCRSCWMNRQAAAALHAALFDSHLRGVHIENCHHLDRFVIHGLERQLFCSQVAHCHALHQLTLRDSAIAEMQHALHDCRVKDEEIQLKLELQRVKIEDLQSCLDQERQDFELRIAESLRENLEISLQKYNNIWRCGQHEMQEISSANERLHIKNSEMVEELASLQRALKKQDLERAEWKERYEKEIEQLKELNTSAELESKNQVQSLNTEILTLGTNISTLEAELQSSRSSYKKLSNKFEKSVKNAEENAMMDAERRISEREKKIRHESEKEIGKLKRVISDYLAENQQQQQKYEQALEKISSITELSELHENQLKENFKEIIVRSVEDAKQLRRKLEDQNVIIEEMTQNNDQWCDVIREMRDQLGVFVSKQSLELCELLHDISPDKDWTHVKFDEKVPESFIAMMFLNLHHLIDESDPLSILERVKNLRLKTFYILDN